MGFRNMTYLLGGDSTDGLRPLLHSNREIVSERRLGFGYSRQPAGACPPPQES